MSKINITETKRLMLPGIKISDSDMAIFKSNFLSYINRVDNAVKNNENEEHIKNIINDFLRMTFYNKSRFSINTDKNIDSTIKENGKLLAIIETKHPGNKTEMITEDNLNKKALWEIVYYYLERTIDVTQSKAMVSTNAEVRRLIITDGYNWYLIDAASVYQIINGEIEKRYYKYKNNQLAYKNDTTSFYEELRQHFDNLDITKTLDYVYFNVNDCLKKKQSLTNLFKVLSENYLLKNTVKYNYEPHSLNSGFYHELLYIMGLKEVVKDKKLVVEIDHTIKNSLSDQVCSLLKDKEIEDDKINEITFELVLIWINRLLFIKLFEGQLISFNNDTEDYHIISHEKIGTFEDLQNLFFDVLGTKDRTESEFHNKFQKIPYLNSSLFERQKIEKNYVFIRYLKNDIIERKSKSVLGRKAESRLPVLQYIIDFLNSYNFSASNDSEDNHNNREIIDAAVLGLIFEKLNGYKDGANYTPSVITEYIAKEAVEKAVINAVNKEMNWSCETIEDLEDKIDTKDEKIRVNEIINNIKICDPAVGSGHFLVSVLNRIIAIKYELGVLFKYNSTKRLKECKIFVKDDILVIVDGDGNPFTYNKNDNESREIQETLFNEKRIIIENCLFGVDINSKAVYICQLRLWIELLKNAYYKNGIMETLPNIDINIKIGNSLLHRYKVEPGKRITFSKEDLTESELKNLKKILRDYKKSVIEYRTVSDKLRKKQIVSEMEILRAKLVENQLTFFDTDKDIKRRRMFQDACEWLIEFPDVLDDDCKFIGFDVIIGNPPYIQLQSMHEEADKLLNAPYKYETYAKTGDIYCLFYEQAYRLLKSNGILAFVTSNKWMRAGYGESLRRFLSTHTNPTYLIDFAGHKVFDSATVDVNILIYHKNPNQYKTLCCVIKDSSWRNNLSDYVQQNAEINRFDSSDSWVILSPVEQSIKKKIEAIGVPLKDWDISINYGIKTGFNDAFIIDGAKKDELISADPKSAEIIRPILRGRDIKRYSFEFADLWLINTHNGIKDRNIPSIDINDYPAVKAYLDQFYDKLAKRADKGNTPYNLRNCIYTDVFSKQKIVWGNLCLSAQYTLVDEEYYINAPAPMVTNGNKYLLSMLNSKVVDWYIRHLGVTRNGGYFEYKPMFVEKAPIPVVDQSIQQKLSELADKIIACKKQNLDTKIYESQIDTMVYSIYKLSDEEITYFQEIVI